MIFSEQVFRLPDHSFCRAFPSLKDSGNHAAFVPGYGGGTATDSHRLPFQPNGPRSNRILCIIWIKHQ